MLTRKNGGIFPDAAAQFIDGQRSTPVWGLNFQNQALIDALVTPRALSASVVSYRWFLISRNFPRVFSQNCEELDIFCRPRATVIWTQSCKTIKLEDDA
jgi:hypothetical protein